MTLGTDLRKHLNRRAGWTGRSKPLAHPLRLRPSRAPSPVEENDASKSPKMLAMAGVPQLL